MTGDSPKRPSGARRLLRTTGAAILACFLALGFIAGSSEVQFAAAQSVIDPDIDSDGDNINNRWDPDDDNDGYPDEIDPDPFDASNPAYVPTPNTIDPD
ncbi:MAG TPA: hypothetical protein VFQ54_07070, partial [Thermomicrobiales bacterium]|nr:hypothetical protein [Thermomicrobiales bacterium]